MMVWVQNLVDLPPVLSVLLKMTVLLSAGWIFHSGLRNSNPRWRVHLWRGVMVGLLLIPIAEFFMPKLFVPVPQPAPPPLIEIAAPMIPMAPTQIETFSAPRPAIEVKSPPPSFSLVQWTKSHLTLLLYVGWGAIPFIIAVRTFFITRRVRRIVKAAAPAPDQIRGLVIQVAADLKCRGRIDLRITSARTSPFLAGLIRPVIVLPEQMADDVHAKELPAVLAHELAHLGSNDLIWMVTGKFVSSLLWFHPLAWKMNAAHATACEQVCDAVAADYVGDATAYSGTLARAALEFVVETPIPGAVPMIRTAEITRRLQNLKRGIQSAALSRPWVATSIILGSVTLVGLGSLKLVYAERADSNEGDRPIVPKRQDALQVLEREKTLRSLQELLRLNRRRDIDVEKLGADHPDFSFASNIGTDGIERVKSSGKEYVVVHAKTWRPYKRWWNPFRRKIYEFHPHGLGIALYFDEFGNFVGQLGGKLGPDKLNGGDVMTTSLGTPDRWFTCVSRFTRVSTGLNRGGYQGFEDFNYRIDVHLVQHGLPLAFRIYGYPNSMAWTDDPDQVAEKSYFRPGGLPWNTQAEGRDGRLHLLNIEWDDENKVFRGPSRIVHEGKPVYEVDLQVSNAFVPTDLPESQGDRRTNEKTTPTSSISPETLSTSAESVQRRTVSFPNEPSMGTLRIKEINSTDSWQMHWVELGEARGEVEVPAGKSLALYVSEEASGDLSPLGELESDDLQLLSITSKKVTDDDLIHLRNLTGLKVLILQGTTIDGSGFVHLKEMKDLEELRLGGHQLTDESIAHLAGLTSLRWLGLWGTGISDEGLAHLTPLQSLDFLALNNTRITDKGLEIVKGFTSLEEGLQISQTRITADGLANLSGLVNLKSIKIDGNRITDDGLKHLQGLTSLENIWITMNPITDDGLTYLSGLKNLRSLYAWQTEITGAGMVHLKELPNLWRLSISGIGDEGVAHLSESPAMEYLGISDAEITEASIPSFQKMKYLSHLYLKGEEIDDGLYSTLRLNLFDCKVWDPSQGLDIPTPAWKRKFLEVYRLEEDEVLKRIAPPFIPERAYYSAINYKSQPDVFWFRWKKELTHGGSGFIDSPSLQYVMHFPVGLDSYDFEGPEDILQTYLPGDWIVRADVSMEEKMKALEKIISDDLGQSIHFVKRQVERDIIVASGAYQFHPEQNTFNEAAIHIYADELDPGSGGGSGRLSKFLRWMGDRVGIAVIDETDTPGYPEVSWANHRSSRLRNFPENERSGKLDLILSNLSKQTRLQFKREQREVEVWFVSSE